MNVPGWRTLLYHKSGTEPVAQTLTYRTLTYHIKEGAPDPDKLDDDRDALARFAVETCKALHAYKVSPVYHLLTYLSSADGEWGRCRDMEGGVRWSIQSALSKERVAKKEYGARVSLAELELLVGDTPVVERAYKDAVAVADGTWFDLDSSRQQLLLL
jgi:hypothetical protein